MDESQQNSMSIAQCIEINVRQYFADLDGEIPYAVYDMVLQQVELPLLRCVMDICEHNQTRAAQMLGLNRNTLRKKLMQYQLLG
ncbi:helix-turn-helix domain-containing protein [Neisseriaceae bacterium ESL0693]|nr:helix-turn-helix domain-containing protein [Neisseriaceae bacterium ESL0693]